MRENKVQICRTCGFSSNVPVVFYEHSCRDKVSILRDQVDKLLGQVEKLMADSALETKLKESLHHRIGEIHHFTKYFTGDLWPEEVQSVAKKILKVCQFGDPDCECRTRPVA